MFEIDDSDIEFDGEEEVSDIEHEPDIESDVSDVNSDPDDLLNFELEDESTQQPVLYMSKDKKIEFSSEPPPMGRAPSSTVGVIANEGIFLIFLHWKQIEHTNEQ